MNDKELEQKEDETAMEVSTVDGVYKLNHEQAELYFLKLNEKIKEQADTIASLKERCDRLEGELNLHIDNDKRRGQREWVYIKLLKDIDRLVYFDHVSNGQELQERIEQALTETKGGE